MKKKYLLILKMIDWKLKEELLSQGTHCLNIMVALELKND